MKKYFNLYALRAVQLALALFIAATLFLGDFDEETGLILSDGLKYLPAVFSGIILVLFCLEFVNARPWIRLVYLILAILICLMMTESLELFNMTAWLCGFIYLWFVLVALIRTRPLLQIKAKIPYKNCLPVGVYTRRSQVCTAVYIVALVAAACGCVLLNEFCDVSTYYTLPPVIAVFIAIMLLYLLKFNAMAKLLSFVNRELSFEKFDTYMSALLKSNLHPETINYLNILRSNYLFAYDKEAGMELFSTVFKPESKSFLPMYEIINIVYLINKGDREEAEAAVRAYGQKHPASRRQLAQLELMLKIHFSDAEIIGIENLLPVNTKIPFNNLSDMIELMTYYFKHGNVGKAQEYARKFLAVDCDFLHWKSEAEAVLAAEDEDKAV